MAFSSSSSSSDNKVPSSFKACSKAYAQLHSQYDKLTNNFCKSQFDVLSYQAGLESIEARLVVYKQNESILEENINLLKNEVQARDTVLVTLRQKLNQAKQERNDLKLKLDKFQSSSKNLTELLASQTNDKHGLGYFSSKSNSEILSPSSSSDRLQPSGRYHAVPLPITGTFMPPKLDLVFHTVPIAVETDHSIFTVQLSHSKPAQDLSNTNRPSASIIEDWVFNSKDESETNDHNNPQSVPSFVQSSEQVKTPRHSVQPVKAPIPDATLKPTSLKSNSSSKRRNRKTCFVCRSVDHLIKDCDFHAKKKAQPTPRNYAHRGYNKQHVSFTHKHPLKHMVPAAVLTQSKPVSITAVIPVCADVPKIMEMMFKINLFHYLLHHHNLKIFPPHPKRVEHLEHDKVAQDLKITKLKKRVKKLERAIRMIDELDKDEGVTLMGEKEEEKKAEEVKDIAGDEHVKVRQAEIYQIDMDHAAKVLSSQDNSFKKPIMNNG
nr:hypothetical protein [Tanacetum cinerariifolium]